MSCYLLTWNPARWSISEFKEYYSRYENGEILRWSCGNTKKIIAGDKFYLLKQGKGDAGIIGSGVVVNAPYVAGHYMDGAESSKKTALYVDVKFEYLLSPGRPVPIRREELFTPKFESNIWNSQSSGNTIPEDIERELSALWFDRVEFKSFATADEVPRDGIFEGAKSTITVNSYERNPEARRKCLQKWGYGCSVCGFNFQYFYGDIGKNYIHVHHLKPIASIGEEYEIDPVEDLRPVCPNCHAMLHKKNPPISIAELKKLASMYGASS